MSYRKEHALRWPNGFALTIIRLAILLIFFALVGSAQATAQSRFVALDGPVQRVVIAPGHTTTLELNRNYEDIVVGNPAVADVFPLTDRSVYIQGRQSGFTNLALYDEEKNLLGVIDIRVQRDLSEIEDVIRQAVPGSQVSVKNVNNRIRLTGQVKDNGDLQAVVQIAQQYTDDPLINAIRVAEARQVQLDVRIMEVSRSSGRELGVDLTTAPNPSFTSSVRNPALPFGIQVGSLLEIGGVSVDLLISALEDRGLARRLANPRLITTSGVEADFTVGGEIPIQVTTVGENGNVSTSTGFRDYGVRLTFLPVVRSDGVINIRIRPEVSDIDPSVGLINGVPGFISRKADTTVSLRDGQSFAIAGLLEANNTRNVAQFPWLGQLPVLGALFRSTEFQKRETDLVILVTPKLVEPATPGQPLSSPLDETRSSNDVELFLLGMLEVDRDLLKYFREGEGVVGPYGHIIDLEFEDGLVVKK